jgi:CheY-specific phosphatase CheX
MISKNPPANPLFEIMATHLADVTVELFAAYDIRVERAAATSAPLGWTETSGMAITGYVGKHVRGALVMIATESAAAAWLKAIGAEEGELADTLGEFSNMLLGRLKGRLLVEGLPILLATPTTASANGFRLSVPPPQSSWQVFDGPGWWMSTRLDAAFDSGFALQATDDRGKPAEAGESILF